MNSTQIPDLSISSSGVTVRFNGSIDMYAHVPGQTATPFLITLLAVCITLFAVCYILFKVNTVYHHLKPITLYSCYW